MMTEEKPMPAEFLVTETLEEGEVARYIGNNQPKSREFRVACGQCGGLGTPNTVYFTEAGYSEAVSDLTPAGIVRALFYHHVIGRYDEAEIVSYCCECGRRLLATLHFI